MPPEPAAGRPCVVAVLRTVRDRHVAAIEAVDPKVRVVRVTDRTTWREEAPETEVIMGFRPLRDGALGSRHLRWVQALGAGVENLCQDVAGTDIRVTNNHVHGDAIADHVFGFVLTHTRRLWEARDCQAARRWVHDELRGAVLAGRTMGILGLGTIGAQVARPAAALGMPAVGGPAVDHHPPRRRGFPRIPGSGHPALLREPEAVSRRAAAAERGRSGPRVLGPLQHAVRGGREGWS